MPRPLTRLCQYVAGATLASSAAWGPPAQASLQSFVARPDAAYHFEVMQTRHEANASVTTLRLTSQTFHGDVWTHLLTLVRPTRAVVADHALMLIGGGHNGGAARVPPAEAKNLQVALDLASKGGLLVALLEEVPNQPVFGGQSEDAAIAYTLTQYFQTGDDSWPLLEAMVKSAVRAMDATQAYAAAAWRQQLTGFTLSGESKRSWTTWLTAAVDPRVKAIVPMVFDMLNIKAQLPHQLASWGEYSEQLGDYAKQGLPQMLATPAGAKLLELIDPYQYRSRLTQPKVLVLATNDRYWPIDAASLYVPALPGPKYLLYIPNCDHQTDGHASIQEDRVALALAAAGRLRLPQLEARVTPANARGIGGIHVTTDLRPTRISVYRASAPTRDFRTAQWREVQRSAPELTFDIATPADAKQWAAVFVELTFLVDGYPFTATSPMQLMPPAA